MKTIFAGSLCLLLAAALAEGQGTIQTVAGNGTAAFSGDGGLATSAALNHSKGLTIDAAGNMYVADVDNYRVRRVSSAGMITTLVGNGSMGAAGDGGLATSATVSDVTGVAVDGGGNIYIADASNRKIRKISATGVISTIAGIGIEGFSGDGGLATSAMLGRPVALALDAAGNLYFADSTSQRVRKISTSGIISTIAGNGVDAYTGEGNAASVSLGFPIGIAIDAAGNIYVADGDNNRVRKITPGGIISTVAGNGQGGFAGDGGLATSASLNIPSDVAVDSAGNLYIADAGNNRVRKVSASGIISTIAGLATNGFSGDGGPSTQAMLNYPWGLAVDASGSLYISDRVNSRVRVIGGTLTAAPSLLDNAAVNGASFVKNLAIAPGAIVTIFGSNFAAGTISSSGAPLPLSIAGTSVTFNGEAAPLFFVSPGQINAQAPFDMATGPVKVQVQRAGSLSTVTTSNAAAFSPGIFIMDQGTSQGAILHAADYTLVGANSPARAGEYISVYSTGLGALRVPVASGAIAPSTPPLAETNSLPIVTIGGQIAVVTYSGLAPGFIGLYQVNVIVPAGLTTGNQPVQINMGGVLSNTATLAVTQ